MSKPHKRFAEALMYESLTAAEEVAKITSEAGPLNKVDGKYQFNTLIQRPRGNPKLFRTTVEEIY